MSERAMPVAHAVEPNATDLGRKAGDCIRLGGSGRLVPVQCLGEMNAFKTPSSKRGQDDVFLRVLAHRA